MSKHSPAPFQLRSHANGHIIVDAMGDSIAALARETGDHLPEEQAANARLFVAAPRLLERLQASTAALLAERESFYDGATAPYGVYRDPDYERIVAEMDAEIDANNAAIAMALGEGEAA